MTIKIKHKRSAVSGKQPLPADLDFGEIAVNYHASGPAIYLKDTAGAIRKIGSLTGALVFKGTVAPTSAAPASRTTGDIWIMNAAGVMAASWIGVAGVAVVKDETIAWDGSEWISLGIDPPTPDATEAAKGIVELATAAETTTGTDATRAVHPAGLKVELDKKVDLAGDTMTGDLTVPSLNGGPLAGFRNVLINGTLGLNQRNVTIAAAAVGKYGPDRWKKVDAGHMTQIVEVGNFLQGATYTLSGTGVTTQQLTAPATGHWTIPPVPITASYIQLERGVVATPFEIVPWSLRILMCQRYYEVATVDFCWNAGAAATDGKIRHGFLAWKRVIPTITTKAKYGVVSATVPTFESVRIDFTAPVSGNVSAEITADAEL